MRLSTKLLIAIGALAAVAFIILFGYFLPKRYAGNFADIVVKKTIEALDPSDPSSFWNIQDIVDLGEDAVDPLIARAGSDDPVTQWTVVSGLSSVRRHLNKRGDIEATMEGMYDSKFLSIQILAAASNLEQGDNSGKQLLLQAQGITDILMYVEPPIEIGEFARRALSNEPTESTEKTSLDSKPKLDWLKKLFGAKDALAKTTVTQDPGDECKFKVTVEIAFAFLDKKAQDKADDLIKTWKDEMNNKWNGPNGYQTFGDCDCQVTFEFVVQKLAAGKDCRQAPAGFHCVNVVSSNSNQRGHVADVHKVPPDGNTNGFGEWTIGASGVDAAHEAGHLMGLDDEYHYEDKDGDGKKETYVNDNVQKDADGNPKPAQSIMATTAGDTEVLPEHVEDIMNNAGYLCPNSCCCGNGKVEGESPIFEGCDPKADPNGCESDQECTEECQCIGGLASLCGNEHIDSNEECDQSAEPNGCEVTQACIDCVCFGPKPEPAPPETVTPGGGGEPAPADTPTGPETPGTPAAAETPAAPEGSVPATTPETPAAPPPAETPGTPAGTETPSEPADQPTHDPAAGGGSSSQTTCGNGVCDTTAENCVSCPSDCGTCPPECGNGSCEDGENCISCPLDCGICPPACGNGSCEAGEDCQSCSADCGECPPVCGDGVCEPGEDCMSCKSDCGECPPVCGNGVCEPGENCDICILDCPCPAICGNGMCEEGEDCYSCPGDCWVCPTDL